MRSAFLASVLAVVLGTAACASADPEAFTKADSEAIRTRSQALVAAFNGKQLDAIIELYGDESVFMPPNAPVLRGREPLRGFYQDLIGRATNLRLETEDVAGSGPLAYESGTYYLNYQDGAVRDRGKYVFVWRKTMDTWRMEKAIWSSDLPPQPPAKGN